MTTGLSIFATLNVNYLKATLLIDSEHESKLSESVML